MFEELGGAWPASYSRPDSCSYCYVTRGGGVDKTSRFWFSKVMIICDILMNVHSNISWTSIMQNMHFA